MRRIAGNEHPARAEAICDQLAPYPGHDREDLEVEGFSESRDDGFAYFLFAVTAHFRGSDDRKPEAVSAIDRNNGGKCAFRVDNDETIEFAFVVQPVEAGAAE